MSYIQDIDGDKRLILASDFVGRPSAIFSDGDSARWSKLRIGVRLCFSDSGANIPTLTPFQFGITSGKELLTSPRNFNHVHSLSLVFNSNIQWVRSTSPTKYSITEARYILSKAGITSTFSADVEGTTSYIAAEDSVRLMIFFDINKTTATNYACTFWRYTSTFGDVDQETFYNTLSTEFPSGPTGFANNGANTNVTVDENADGYFDRVHFYWVPTNPRLKVSDIGLFRFR